MLSDYMEKKPVLQTRRLRIRSLVKEDVPALREWMPDPALYAYWGKKAGKTDKDPSLLFVVPEKPTQSFHWGLEELQTGKVMGEVWVYLIEKNRMAKVAFRIAESRKGLGFATEALEAVVAFCFSQTELQRLWTDVDVRNAPSCCVLENVGFQKEGHIRQGKMVSTWCDYFLYGLLRSEWEASSGRKISPM